MNQQQSISWLFGVVLFAMSWAIFGLAYPYGNAHAGALMLLLAPLMGFASLILFAVGMVEINRAVFFEVIVPFSYFWISALVVVIVVLWTQRSASHQGSNQ